MLELIFETLECIDQELCFQPRAGALQQLGHMDFYPDGGSSQVLSYCQFNHHSKSMSALNMLLPIELNIFYSQFWFGINQSIKCLL